MELRTIMRHMNVEVGIDMHVCWCDVCWDLTCEIRDLSRR